MENILIEEKQKNNKEEIYKNIIFEKNVYTSACEYFKNYNKIFILTSPTPRDSYLQFFINVLNENGINYSISVLNKGAICDNDTILKTCSRAKDFNLIVSFGTGTLADITKIVANNLNLPFCVVPTAITHYGIFNNLAYLIENGLPKVITTKYPEKVFIDVDIIKKSPEKFVLSSIFFAVSLVENLFILEVQKKILKECNIDILALNKKIKKIEELLNWVALSKDFALLNLMDYIIDLSELCKDHYVTNSIMYSLSLNCSTLKSNFGEKCMLSSTILLNLYTSFLNQKIISIKNSPERERIIKYYSKKKFQDNFFENYMKNTEVLLDKNLNHNFNVKKVELFYLLNYQKNALSKFVKKTSLISNENKIRMIDESELYITLELLPFIHNNFLLNVMTRYGYLNVS